MAIDEKYLRIVQSSVRKAQKQLEDLNIGKAAAELQALNSALESKIVMEQQLEIEINERSTESGP